MKEEKKKGTLSRLFEYVIGRHKVAFLTVVISVVISVAANVLSNTFMQVIIDEYLLKMIRTGEDLFGGLAFTIGMLGIVYLIAVMGTFLYTRGMAKIGQSVLKEIRDDLFSKMQKLPIAFLTAMPTGM